MKTRKRMHKERGTRYKPLEESEKILRYLDKNGSKLSKKNRKFLQNISKKHIQKGGFTWKTKIYIYYLLYWFNIWDKTKVINILNDEIKRLKEEIKTLDKDESKKSVLQKKTYLEKKIEQIEVDEGTKRFNKKFSDAMNNCYD